MRILYTNFHQGNGGGHDTYISSLVKGLAASHEVIIAAPETSRLYNNIKAVHSCLAIDYKLRFDRGHEFIRHIKQMRSWIKHYKFDIIHANGSNDHTMLILAIRGLKQPPKLIFTKHNSLPIKIGAKLRLRYFTDGIIAVSQYTRQQLSTAVSGKVPVAVIPNGIDINQYSPVSFTHKSACRLQYGLSDKHFVFVSVAGTSSYKGWYFLIQAAAKLPAALRDRIRIIIAGAAPSESDLGQWVNRFHMQSQVTFTGMLDDVREIIAIGDVGFVLSHEIETISFACREMMAMALPVLVSDYAGLPENIDPEKDGWIVPAKDISALTQCIATIMTTPNLLEMGQQAREKAVCHFGQADFINNTLAFYANLANRV